MEAVFGFRARDMGINEHKDEDALSTLEIAVEIDAEKAARPAEGVVAPAASSQGALSPEYSRKDTDNPDRPTGGGNYDKGDKS